MRRALGLTVVLLMMVPSLAYAQPGKQPGAHRGMAQASVHDNIQNNNGGKQPRSGNKEGFVGMMFRGPAAINVQMPQQQNTQKPQGGTRFIDD